MNVDVFCINNIVQKYLYAIYSLSYANHFCIHINIWIFPIVNNITVSILEVQPQGGTLIFNTYEGSGHFLGSKF